MKKYLAIILTLISFQSQALTGDGEAKINMIKPLTLTQTQSVDFGNIAVDGAGVVYLSGKTYHEKIYCSGFNSHSCPSLGTRGLFLISGKEKTSVSLSIVRGGILANENGDIVTFSPEINTENTTLNYKGERVIKVGGTISLSGNETAGEYSTLNSGGSPYQINVIY